MSASHLRPAALALFVLTGAPRAARAQGFPPQLNHQGRLFDATMQPVTGMHTMTFAIYGAATGGTALWMEAQMGLTFTSGYYSTTLGSVVPFPMAFTAGQGPFFLGIKIDADAEMTPREPVAAVPFALAAQNAVGDITPTSVRVNGVTVIDSMGNVHGIGSGVYCGHTDDYTTGSFSGPMGQLGYRSAKAKCEQVASCGPSPMAHMCSLEEIARGEQLGVAAPAAVPDTAGNEHGDRYWVTGGGAPIYNGGGGNVGVSYGGNNTSGAMATDCDGYVYDNPDVFGTIWRITPAALAGRTYDVRAPAFQLCSLDARIACCK